MPGASCFDYNLACGEYMNYLKGEILKNVTFDWPNKFPLQPTRLFPERFLNTFRHLVTFETVARQTLQCFDKLVAVDKSSADKILPRIIDLIVRIQFDSNNLLATIYDEFWSQF